MTPLGVDEQEVVGLRDASGVVAVISASMSAATPTRASVSGTHARLELAGPFYGSPRIDLIDSTGRIVDAWESRPEDVRTGLRYEAVELARLVAEGRRESPLLPRAETQRVMGLLDDIRGRLGVVLPGE